MSLHLLHKVNGGLENMINWEGRDKDTLALVKYIADEDKLNESTRESAGN